MEEIDGQQPLGLGAQEGQKIIDTRASCPEGREVLDEDVARLSPLKHVNLNLDEVGDPKDLN
ncbi:transposase [Nonomuraea sediminis]|uniref:transposase n=1 Tax=Nonomuraea sediminis TaxID=2835864 RepID=UPI001BDCED37|nr:transposase [Nonomuraea sediminis]